MLGRESGQTSLAEAYLWTGKTTPLVEPGSFYDRFAKVRPELLRDEDFAHWYVEGKGRPSVPPSRVAGAYLMALREGCSDREAEQRMRFDLRWKWALNLGLDDYGCDHTTICLFRGRLLAHEEEGKLFKELVKRAVAAGLLPKRALQVMDSSPMLGAAAVQDTYKLIRTALHKVVKAHEKDLPAELRPRLKRYLKTGKPDIDWDDAGARKQELNQLVRDAELALSELSKEKEGPTAQASRELLERVARQDVEPDGEGGVKIRKGVAPDRVVSTVDPEMRHGRKSSAGRWDGSKKHLSVEPKDGADHGRDDHAGQRSGRGSGAGAAGAAGRGGPGASRGGGGHAVRQRRAARPRPSPGRRHDHGDQGGGQRRHRLPGQGGVPRRPGGVYGQLPGGPGGAVPALPARAQHRGGVRCRRLRRLSAGKPVRAEAGQGPDHQRPPS